MRHQIALVTLLLVSCNAPNIGPKMASQEFTNLKVKYQPPLPPYPPLAKIARIQGNVVVRVTVGLDGVPLSAKALEGPSQLHSVAEKFGLQWRFYPCHDSAVTKPGHFMFTMPFRLHDDKPPQ